VTVVEVDNAVLLVHIPMGTFYYYVAATISSYSKPMLEK